MKVVVVTRAMLSENDVYADAYVGKDRASAIKAAVEGCMLDWWRDYQNDSDDDEEDGTGMTSYEQIYNEYVKMFGDEEKFEINEEEVVGL